MFSRLGVLASTVFCTALTVASASGQSTRCQTDQDCAGQEYCQHETGDCSGQGICVARPEACPPDDDPICGCDGRTYANPCSAAQAGVSVAAKGICADQPPSIIRAVSRRSQGYIATADIDLLHPLSGAILAAECRLGGPTQIVVTFDRAVQLAVSPEWAVRLAGTAASNGRVTSATANGAELTIDIAEAPEAARLSLTFPGIVDEADRVVQDVLNFGVLVGDVNGDGLISILDLLAVRNGLNQPTSANNVRIDVSADGTINLLDMLTIRNHLNLIVPRMPVLKAYSNSGCLARASAKRSTAATNSLCGDDEITVTVEGNTLRVVHKNATYNCCLTEIRTTLTVVGRTLRLAETEYVPAPCKCLCCYESCSTIANLAPGTYTVELFWRDDETQGPRCLSQETIIP
ncbi:MAG TPA: dockerin type I domain-containing protein [Phycisphaerae bacterium]|nr:dockerin type I domain-containing protein [Phycisphaerae bacterium]HRY70282.1 dockerin type I domain-containing protein [Phycisphaerae bacterium]HSA27547.1 dockerin type I domain-containing protein [Phycisphaerae bacterium]